MSFYRFLEIIPGFLAWTTLIVFVLAARFLPTYVSIFIILFDTYWLFKTVYLYFHLRVSYKELRANLKINWLTKLEKNPRTADRWRKIYHLVILPMYKEPYEVVAETFEALSRVNYPLDRLIVVLAEEEKGGAEALATGERIRENFGSKFFRFIATVHPADIPGELAGKGSNETWAAKEAKQKIIDSLSLPYEDIIASVFDVDTQVASEYFGRLAEAFLTAPNPQRSSYQPIPFFINNVFEAPALARVVAFSTTFWGLMEQSRPEHIETFSSHATPFKALAEIGFWETNVVSEDSRIFWQLYLHYHGDWRTVPLKYPISLDVNVASTFWGTVASLYKQQRRWAWGAENFPYVVSGFLKNRAPLSKKLSRSFNILEGVYSWSTSAFLVSLGGLPVVIGGKEFNATVLSYSLPVITGYLAYITSLGLIISGILGAALLPPRPKWFKRKHGLIYFLQWFLTPISMIFLGAVPALEAQTRLMLGGRFRLGFWPTPKSRLKKEGVTLSASPAGPTLKNVD